MQLSLKPPDILSSLFERSRYLLTCANICAEICTANENLGKECVRLSIFLARKARALISSELVSECVYACS